MLFVLQGLEPFYNTGICDGFLVSLALGTSPTLELPLEMPVPIDSS